MRGLDEWKNLFLRSGCDHLANLRISDNVSPMFVVNDASYLQFIGLEIVYNRGGAFFMTKSTSVQINGCIIHEVDEDTVVINGGTKCGVHSSNLHNLGAEGVFLQVADSASSKCGHNVTNCHTYNFGVLNNIYAGGVNVQSGNYGSTVRKNLLHDSPNLGVFIECANTLFEANDVFRMSELTNDIGAFTVPSARIRSAGTPFATIFRTMPRRETGFITMAMAWATRCIATSRMR